MISDSCSRAGLAGLRFGYAVAHETIVQYLMAIKQARIRNFPPHLFIHVFQPYNVSTAAEVAVLAAMEHQADIQLTIDAIKLERDIFFAQLETVSAAYSSRNSVILLN